MPPCGGSPLAEADPPSALTARHAELAVMIFAALMLATAGAFLGALGDRSTTDDPLDDPLDDPPRSDR